ncbi:MAG: glucose-6-phosphate isomerase, partial [Verrucomicrobia bacterium]|nr:glucose-6-phosphate isomerase [Verrucomicrobiota bacterium]
FARHAVAVTSDGSQLDQVARQQGWLEVFPMWDWVGGRTSELSAVGLLPAALQGLDIQAMLAGARDCDVATREANPMQNPAALLAMMWYHAGQGKGDKAMVILPYKDRLELFSKYLQQLVMESLGKADDLEGQRVEQGIVVYGNKGSTDQHAYIQQLRDGRNDFFATFLEVLRDRQQVSIEVEPGVTSGDFLQGFLLGTRAALHGNQRESITLTLSEVNPRSVGMLIALYERAVGLYAFMIGINAYHQPGVEAGKKAAGEVIALQTRFMEYLKNNPSEEVEVESLAAKWGADCDPETLFKICEHLAANPDRGIEKIPGATPFQARYRLNVN